MFDNVQLVLSKQQSSAALQIDLDDEDRDIDGNGSHGLYNAAKTTAKKALNTESDSDFDLEYRPPVKRYVPCMGTESPYSVVQCSLTEEPTFAFDHAAACMHSSFVVLMIGPFKIHPPFSLYIKHTD